MYVHVCAGCPTREISWFSYLAGSTGNSTLHQRQLIYCGWLRDHQLESGKVMVAPTCNKEALPADSRDITI